MSYMKAALAESELSLDQPAPFWQPVAEHDGTEDEETLIMDAFGDKEIGWWNDGWHTNAKGSSIDLEQIKAFCVIPNLDY